MYTMSGITVSEGVSAGRAFLLLPQAAESASTAPRALSASDESLKYRKASREFANKLNNAMSGTVPDKVRDLFGAVSSYITNAANIRAIDEQIAKGQSAINAAKAVLLPKIARFSHEDAELSAEEAAAASGTTADSSDPEMQVVASELSSLMRDFIATIDSVEDDSEMSVPRLNEPSVIIASDLTPARFLSLHTELVRAVVLEGGQASGHLGTVLRDLCIPAIYGVKGALTIKNGEHVLVDATRGSILVEPPQDTAQALIAQQDLFTSDDDDPSDSDIEVTVAGSMGAIGEIDRMARYLNHGLGLLRSEFLFLNYHHEPSVEEMVHTFASIFAKIPKSAPLTARTFDFAGDKKPLFTLDMDETGPLASYGAQVGSALLHKELRALLLAAAGREINIVFPLITRISEAKTLTALLAQVIEELQAEDVPFGNAHVAVMIETPAAVLSAKAFASFGELFLIGTSSLAEYASAPRPPEDYFTPALAKMIAIACKGAHDVGVRVGIAGRFAMRTELLPFFLSLGVSYLTTDATSITKVRKELQSLADQGHSPHFDAKLYANLMDIASTDDLQQLLFHDDFA